MTSTCKPVVSADQRVAVGAGLVVALMPT